MISPSEDFYEKMQVDSCSSNFFLLKFTYFWLAWLSWLNFSNFSIFEFFRAALRDCTYYTAFLPIFFAMRAFLDCTVWVSFDFQCRIWPFIWAGLIFKARCCTFFLRCLLISLWISIIFCYSHLCFGSLGFCQGIQMLLFLKIFYLTVS